MNTATASSRGSFYARARFFTHAKIETRPVQIDDDGTVLVWDDIARYFTRCHALGAGAQRRIRRIRRAAKAVRS